MLYNEKIGAMTPDNLVASGSIRMLTQGVTLASGQGILKRGTVVALSGGKGKIMNTGLTPHGVLCDDVDTTSADVLAEVYVTGCFNKAALIVASGYELTAENAKTLRDAGIFFENILD